MQELLTCPVCTLYLRPGMSLEDHLETHPKDQVIKALVALAITQRPSPEPRYHHSSSSSQNYGNFSEHDQDYNQPHHPPPPPLQPQSQPEPQQFYLTPNSQSRQNVMIVNRNSRTMVYHAATAVVGRDHQPPHRIIAQSTFVTPSQLHEILNLPQHSQARQMPPPPAYGTAINQLRSQQNQSSIGFHNNQHSPESFSPPPTHRSSPCNQLPSRVVDSPRSGRSPNSPLSVLRYAESPISAQYVERENGDFLVQESPRHIVEYVESENGNFSVIEKVVQSPPSLVQFSESDNEECVITDCNINSEMHTEMIDNETVETEANNNNNEIVETEANDNDDEATITSRAVKDVQVISNVKLDPTESLELMENLGNIQASVEGELIWSDMECVKSEAEPIAINDDEEVELLSKEADEETTVLPVTGSSATSVIRLASNKPATCPKSGKQICAVKKEIRPPVGIKRPFRKQPKKLTVKFKVAIPGTTTDSDSVNDGNSELTSTATTATQVQTDVNLDVEVNRISLDDKQMSCTSRNQTDVESESNSVLQSEIISDNAINLNRDETAEASKPKADETDNISVKLEKAHPMIVHEPSLSQEPHNELAASREFGRKPVPHPEHQDDQPLELELSRLLEQSVQSENIQSCSTTSSSTSTSINRCVKLEPDRISSTVDYTSSICSADNMNSSLSKDTVDSSSFNTISSLSMSKPSTSSFTLSDEQLPAGSQPCEPNHLQQAEFNADYSFSLLYGCANAAEDQPWSRYVMQQNVPQFQELDNERSNYIDLDTFKITNCDVVQQNTLNIRTDEKMPAKGEISEQESNGDVDNSWSNPHFVGSGFRFVNSYENWTGTTDGIVPFTHTFAAELKSEPMQTADESDEKKPLLAAANIEIRKSSARRSKTFRCGHCELRFPLLKERNAHLIEKHGYKRINRRLIRDSPPSTVTTENIRAMEGDVPMAIETSVAAIAADSGDADDIKPDVKTEITVSSTIDATVFPRTKYDSIRAGVYRMLMNFNMNVLKSKNIEVDKTCFESKSFCCFTCKRDFISVKLYDEHLAEHPAECFTCGKKFTRWTYFSLHLKRHLGWKDFACSICEKKFVIRSALIEHMRMHTGVAPLKCNMCDKHFKRYSNLTQHKKVCHSTRLNKKKDYVCHCGEVLPSKARFLWHKETHETRPKVCPYCRDRFVHRNSLKRHIRLTHSDKFNYTQPVKCKECKKVYAKTSMKAHMLTHSIDTQFECSICNKSFTTKWNLKIHMWVHANRAAKPFKCEHCVKAFVREIDHKNHVNSHKNIKPFTCEHCGCKFVRKYNYMRHRQEHTSQKRFKCDLCCKMFHRNYYLIEHRRMHTGERPFLCTICGKSSTTKTNHNKHLRIHHSRDPFTSEA